MSASGYVDLRASPKRESAELKHRLPVCLVRIGTGWQVYAAFVFTIALVILFAQGSLLNWTQARSLPDPSKLDSIATDALQSTLEEQRPTPDSRGGGRFGFEEDRDAVLPTGTPPASTPGPQAAPSSSISKLDSGQRTYAAAPMLDTTIPGRPAATISAVNPFTATPASVHTTPTAVKIQMDIDRNLDHWRFINDAIGPAQISERETTVPASVTIAQAIHESDWGTSRLSSEANNYFGIKATSKPGTNGVTRMPTGENLGGRNVTVTASFRAYNDMAESFVDHGRFFIENDRYARAIANANDPRAFIRLIADAGYATDPSYARKVLAYMDKYNLYEFDLP